MNSKKLVYLHYILKEEKYLYKYILNKKLFDDIDEYDVENYINTLKYKYITVYEKTYYKYIKNLNKPPLIIYYIGDINLLESNILLLSDGINSNYSNKIIDDIFKYNKEVPIIYSKSNIKNDLLLKLKKNNKKFIYIEQSSIKHFLLKEYEYKQLILNNSLLVSTSNNNIHRLLHLINNIAIIEATINSYINIIVNDAHNYNIDTYVVPTLLYDKYTLSNNKLLQDGAQFISFINKKEKYV